MSLLEFVYLALEICHNMYAYICEYNYRPQCHCIPSPEKGNAEERPPEIEQADRWQVPLSASKKNRLTFWDCVCA